MNILYISALEGGKYTGPLYSVPKRITSQSKYDNVYWVNLTNIENSCLFDKNLYHYVPLKKFRFENLPSPFDKPDLIVFEEFFKMECCIVAKMAEKKSIPYIIVPRCQMTKDYLKNKKIKKLIAGLIFFKHFAKKALAVQFLSNQEKDDSFKFYKGKSFVIPNGIIEKSKKAKLNGDIIKVVFIGRYSVWQKGIDLLFEAIYRKKNKLKDYNFEFNLYGPDDRTGSRKEIENLAKEKKVDEIVNVYRPVFDEEKEKVLLDASVFIHTSRFEGMPMSVLDAISYGLPCLVTQGSNLREDIEKFSAGWGSDNNVESIEKALEKMIEDIEKFNQIGENAKKLAKNYSWDVIAEKTHNIYSDMLN